MPQVKCIYPGVVARLVEVHCPPMTRTLLTSRTLQRVPPHSNRAPHKDPAPKKELRLWQTTLDKARRLWWVKPHAVRLHHPPSLVLAFDVLVQLNRGEESSFRILLEPGNVGRWDAIGFFPSTHPALQLHLQHKTQTCDYYCVESNVKT